MTMEHVISDNASRLYDAIKDLSEPELAEVLDFAEFLRQKQSPTQAEADDVLLTSLVGGLENSETFKGDSLTLQKKIPD
jgi:hypothetical protein